jgi:predicted aldo/keto reductase-like oxidoreductase
MERRKFLAASAATLAAQAAAPLPRRPYKAGIELSVIGFGGIVVCGMPQAEADRRVAASFDRGVNYFDCAPSYFDGEAELKLGPALKPYRAKVFLAEKTQRRDAAGARQELERSLQRFSTDHFDLYQFHAVSSLKDVEQILATGGAAETFQKAKQEGKIRFLGFSAHHPEAAIKLMDALAFDSILFPVNWAAWNEGQFGPQIMAAAKRKGVARLALKALAYSRWPAGQRRDERKYPKCWYQPVDDRELALQALRFTLSEDVTAAIPPGDERIYDLALELAPQFKPLTAPERTALAARAKGLDPIFRA